jgi:hypothetical protein
VPRAEPDAQSAKAPAKADFVPFQRRVSNPSDSNPSTSNPVDFQPRQKNGSARAFSRVRRTTTLSRSSRTRTGTAHSSTTSGRT